MKSLRIIISKYIVIATIALSIISCADFMEPSKDSYVGSADLLKSRDYFVGVLYRAYLGIPTRVNLTYEAATDNLVANNENSATSKAAKYGISAQSNPLGDTWSNDYTYINYINWYIEHMVLDNTKTVPTPVIFDSNPSVNLRTFYYTLGEAYFLRAWYEFDLLQKYGGVGADDKVYGFPIRTSSYKETDNLNIPRNTYEECVAQIAKDCDSAYMHLPLDYNNMDANSTFDNGSTASSGHASGIAAKTLKAKAYLLSLIHI